MILKLKTEVRNKMTDEDFLVSFFEPPDVKSSYIIRAEGMNDRVVHGAKELEMVLSAIWEKDINYYKRNVFVRKLGSDK